MELIKACDVSGEELHTLVDTNRSIDTNKLHQAGYVIKQIDRLEGCFVLEKTEKDVYWLRQMYITKDAVTSLPVLLEAVLALAKKKQAESVVIHSHQTAIDTILEALQFSPRKDMQDVDKSVDNSGRWWTYSVS